jgi:tRNA threonylcarbamoyl adenosine modification protein YeaZ
MVVLAIDTSTPYLVLGLPRYEWTVRLERRHAEAIWDLLDEFLQRSHTVRENLQGIAVGEGPGSYTGIRVGVAAGLGLARGLGLPVVGVGSLEACQRYPQPVTAAFSQRNEQVFRSSSTGQSIKDALSGLYSLPAVVLDQPPSGRRLAHLGAQALQQGRRGIHPIYL